MSHSPKSHREILNNYQHIIEIHDTSVQKLKKDKRVISISRLITVFTGIGVCWYFWPDSRIILTSTVLFSIAFILLVFRDADKTAAINNCERLIRINRHEMDAMQQNLHGYDNGQFFADPAHPYASDLDLFGPSSL